MNVVSNYTSFHLDRQNVQHEEKKIAGVAFSQFFENSIKIEEQ